ncbi:SCO family protein [Piscinibacter sp.]|uniref:SCO family protein n=1 Tax=Piscinibacter sp. TaxID=1903157 RepID=UPI0039E3DEF7
MKRRQFVGAAALAPWGVRAATDAASGPLVKARVDTSRLPAPGSYKLARIMAAPAGIVLDTQGRTQRLHTALLGRLSVVSFIYTYCRDPDGCPKAWAALDGLHASLRADPALARHAQIVSISFDPTHDTPEVMRLHASARSNDPAVRWRFFTTSSVGTLLPLLRGFGQDVSVETDAAGRPTRTLNHLLKLFLVDAQLQIREIYGVATLAPQALLNDLRTLDLEQRAAP